MEGRPYTSTPGPKGPEMSQGRTDEFSVPVYRCCHVHRHHQLVQGVQTSSKVSQERPVPHGSLTALPYHPRVHGREPLER